MNNEFLIEVKSKKRVFGNPQLVYTDLVKQTENEIKKNNMSYKPGEFIIPNKELNMQLAKYKKQRQAIQKVGDYMLGLFNKVNDPIWNNSFLFCNIFFNQECKPVLVNSPKEDINEEININSSFINSEELGNIMNTNVTGSNEVIDLNEAFTNNYELYSFVIQNKRETILIKISVVNTNPEIPIFVDGNCVYDARQMSIVEFSPLRFSNFKVLNVIYNNTGCCILKNNAWRNANETVIHISELKKFIENSYKEKEDLNFDDRINDLTSFYESFYRKSKTDFQKIVDDNMIENNLK